MKEIFSIFYKLYTESRPHDPDGILLVKKICSVMYSIDVLPPHVLKRSLLKLKEEVDLYFNKS